MAAHPLTSRAADDVQGLVLQGYGKLRAARYLLLSITDGAAARRWLAALLDEVTFGSGRPPTDAVNVAFTPTGLTALGLPAVTLGGFAPEFVEGMASAHRSRLLGDVEGASPAHWSWGGPDTPPVDALLLLFSRDEPTLTRSLARHRRLLEVSGLGVIGDLETHDIGFDEHFGFRDGISQPVPVEGRVEGRVEHRRHDVALGEFLLGHLNGHGQYARSPLVPAQLDAGDLLPRRRTATAATTVPVPPALADGHDFGHDGSYLVVRSLAQDVGGFWRHLDALTQRADGSSDEAARTALAAKLVGRWPGGAPLTRSPDDDDPRLATENDFGYHAEDRDGDRCPLGAHVRRANPRDSLPPKPGTAGSLDVANRHRLLRRGRPYGPRIEAAESLTEDPHGAPERGLHFLALCADIARQFEFVSHTWAMNRQFAGLLDDPDPLLGGYPGAEASFTVQATPVRRRITGLPSFVTPRGGGYFFLPSRRALAFLAHASGARTGGAGPDVVE